MPGQIANHQFMIAFSVDSPVDDPKLLRLDEILTGLLERTIGLGKDPSWREALEHTETYVWDDRDDRDKG